MIFESDSNICEAPQSTDFKPCGGNLCKDKQKCIPSETFVNNCLAKLIAGNLPDECICINHELDSASTDIYIYNNTSNTLELVLTDKSGDVCKKHLRTCSTVVRTDYDVDKCQIGSFIYPNLVTDPPTTIPPLIAALTELRADFMRYSLSLICDFV